MATTATPTAFYRAAAPTVSTTLYTVPGATTAIVTDLTISNTDTTSHTATISLDGIVLVPAVSVAANTIVDISLKQVLATGKIIAGFASSATVNFHVSGVQLT